MNKLDHISIPEFSNFKQTPNNHLCKVIDTTRLMVEILWWLERSNDEFSESTYSSKLLLDWKYSLVIRYKREKDNKFHPAVTLSFDVDENENICIDQFQWSNDKHISFRFFSSFDSINFYLKLIEESFSKKWIYTYVKNIPDWLENASYASNAWKNYKKLTEWIKSLNDKYNLNKDNK
jgi:hypothetical protein